MTVTTTRHHRQPYRRFARMAIAMAVVAICLTNAAATEPRHAVNSAAALAGSIARDAALQGSGAGEGIYLFSWGDSKLPA